MPQAEINALLVAKAQEGKMVVRLKGGDPFVFGRGGEEVLALQAAGIPYEVVSGVSSAVAVPAAAGIPVTHRRLARSFHVITGHTAADGAETLTEQIDTLAKLEGTLVFLPLRLSFPGEQPLSSGLSARSCAIWQRKQEKPISPPLPSS